MRYALVLLFLLLTPAAGFAPPVLAQAPASVVRHAIQATLDPPAKTLTLRDAITLPENPAHTLTLTLSPRAALTQTPPDATFTDGLLRIPLAPGQTQIALAYTLELDAQSEDAPGPPGSSASMDMPGASAPDAAAGPDWAMLMPASLWHPQAKDQPNTYVLAVTAPLGVRAVGQGRLEGFEDRDGNTVSTWIIDHPVERLGLCAARYAVERDDSGPVPVLTFLLADNASLARTYLQASVAHLRFYQDLLGPYPLEKFAVVENPLPTGYGFPSYTLLGSQVIRLPFIPETSLRHEIAHSWWGNGVLVDPSQGNWCEGLTVYVADYLSQELASPAAGLDYRRQTLRAFASLVRSGSDFPLERFGMRSSAASQAVGYGKGMFVFHMLRQQVGDAAFWQGLRRFYAAKLFQEASWEDIRATFAGLPDFSEEQSRRFFKQWLSRTGGPRLKLADVKLARTHAGYAVRASLLQEGPPYALRLPFGLDAPSSAEGTVPGDPGELGRTGGTEGSNEQDSLGVQPGRERRSEQPVAIGSAKRIILSNAHATPFTVESAARPVRLSIDPAADVFCILDDAEIPPSVNSLKGSQSLLVIVASDAPPAVRQALPILLAALGQPEARVVEEEHMPPAVLKELSARDILYAGAPGGHAQLQPTPGLTLSPGGFSLADAPQADTLLAVLPRAHSARFTAVFQTTPQATPEDAAQAAGKATHYGRFGVLAFSRVKNIVKTTAETGMSPLVRELKE